MMITFEQYQVLIIDAFTLRTIHYICTSSLHLCLLVHACTNTYKRFYAVHANNKIFVPITSNFAISDVTFPAEFSAIQ